MIGHAWQRLYSKPANDPAVLARALLAHSEREKAYLEAEVQRRVAEISHAPQQLSVRPVLCVEILNRRRIDWLAN